LSLGEKKGGGGKKKKMGGGGGGGEQGYFCDAVIHFFVLCESCDKKLFREL